MPRYRLLADVFVSPAPDLDPTQVRRFKRGEEITYYGEPSAVMEPLDAAGWEAHAKADARREKAGLAPATRFPFQTAERLYVGKQVTIPDEWESMNNFALISLAKELGGPNRMKADDARVFIAKEVEKRKLG